MGQITSSVGLISGINTGAIIDSLMQIESEPVTLLQTEIQSDTDRKTAYTGLATQLASLQASAKIFQQPESFENAAATSSDQNVLTATADSGAATGNFQFQVSQLVSTQNSISAGFADPDATHVGAGTLTLSQGGGELTSATPLEQLNGGDGVSRGEFRITDKSGKTDVVDISNAVTLDDVIQKINTSLDISVKASLSPNGINLTDTSGGTGNLVVQDLANGSAAANLGIVANTATTSIAGTSINFVGRDTLLSQLNDGRGVNSADASSDFTITDKAGHAHAVNVNGLSTVGQVIDAINTATGGAVKADLAPGATGLRLTDTTGGGAALTVTPTNSSTAAADLGLTAPASGNVLNGAQVLSDLGTVSIGSLNGGNGLNLGTINVTDKLGHFKSIDLSSAKSVQDVINLINSNGTALVTASLSPSEDGIQITDNSGGSNNLVVAEGNKTTAADLGLIGSTDTDSIVGKNLQRQYVSDNTLLKDYNGGKGVSQTQFTITNSKGIATTIDLSSGSSTTIGDLINNVNNRGIGVTASINAQGNGILLTDSSGGAGHLAVTDVNGTAAQDLNILGTATANTIDGSLEKTITVDANDTLTTLQNKINTLGWGVSASIVNDGSGTAPYRLSLTANNSGKDGRVVIDSGSTNLQVRNLVDAQDAAVFLGGAGSTQPLLVTSSTNQITNVIKGVTVNLVGVSSTPVTLSVTRDASNISTELGTFVTNFNSMVDSITTDTAFDSTSNTGGVLLGDETVQQIQSEMYDALNTVVTGAGSVKILSDIGLTITDGAKLAFDPNKFNQAYASDPQGVESLFSQTSTGIGWVLNNAINNLTDPVTGVITIESQTLDARTQGFNDQITELNAVLAEKRSRLEEQFANMESVLAGLQGQQAALSSLSSVSTPKASTSNAGSSASSSNSSSNDSSSSGSASSS